MREGGVGGTKWLNIEDKKVPWIRKMENEQDIGTSPKTGSRQNGD